MKKVLIMAGGTGGHIFPALSVALALQERGHEIIWLGTKERMEADIIPLQGISIEYIAAKPLRGKGIISLLKAPLMLARSLYQAIKIMRKINPNVVLGMGGFVCGPGGVAAKLCNIPLVIHEQNAVAGLTNKLLHRIANTTLQAFPHAFNNAKVVGNPIRRAISTTTSHAFAPADDVKRILVVGGSQGARVINRIMPHIAHRFLGRAFFYHQVGRGNLAQTLSDYAHFATTNVECVEFIEDMAQQYALSDCAIARSGALTVAEFTAVGMPAIFIPFNHKDRQQLLNAQDLAAAGGCYIIEEKDLSADFLSAKIEEILTACRYQQMASIMKAHGHAHAQDAIVDTLCYYLKD